MEQPPVHEPPADPGDRLRAYLTHDRQLKSLTHKQLVAIVMGNDFPDVGVSAFQVLSEMCSRLHPGWENEPITGEDVRPTSS